MKQSTIILIGLAVALVWLGSLALTYQQTRTKWFALGTNSGVIHGQALVLEDLCNHAISGAAPQPVIWSLGVKAGLVELSGENGRYSLHCR